ncbi:flagellar basal-body MS-ring/collar protein FliF [Massilia sp. S19_KUP03_FR1]|uniref:flagellar basal-body MS-ring/collar protein FliF n=1 Tax=Massilia sp. S19_KUP03_FR1 TaxID=3025503 RepID=UPI002FCDDE26
MTAIQEFWDRFDRSARAGLLLGVIAIVGVAIALGVLLLRTDYEVLFADLAPQDAATITSELDKLKMPYRLARDGNTILVPADQVHKTRLKLVGRELPLRGAVGFELFNTSEVGMTEFTQKVNFQRALQGELTRTIMALDEVQSVRVHLVLADQGLFKKTSRQAKASISIALKPGHTLQPVQVQGIQRLVSAAVPDIRAADVTVVDQHGVALTRRSAEGPADDGAGSDGLDDKRALESYLQKKVTDVLDRTFGAGLAIASVDVTLGHTQTKVTTESVLGNGTGTGAGAGVKVRERVTTQAATADADADHPAPTSRESDYQVGRRVEQVVSGAGGIARVNVAVVVRANQDQEQLERLRDVVALAAGIDRQRGDAVSVYAMDQLANPMPVTAASIAALATPAPDTVATAPVKAPSDPRIAVAAIVLAALVALLAIGALALGRRRHEQAPLRNLSMDERRAVLAQVNAWLEAPRVPARAEVP